MTRLCSEGQKQTGWALYSWAFHGFVTTVASVLLGPYLTSLAQAEVGENGLVFSSRLLGTVTAKAYFFDCLSVSVLLQVILLPLLGAIADYTSLKKPLLFTFSTIGALATCALYFVGGGLGFRAGGAVFALANLAFGASVVLYNAFLPEVASHDDRDRVSSLGAAVGYLSGGILLAANLAFMTLAPRLGISSGQAVRLCFLSAGVWWIVFSIPSALCLPSAPGRGGRVAPTGLLGLGVSQLRNMFRKLSGRPQTLLFLIAYLLYNDGIQTVIGVAAVFLEQELFIARGLPANQSFLLANFLMVQFVGFAGALLFAKLAEKISTKRALLLSLVTFCGVIVYGYAFLQTTRDAFAMSAVIALVLGGSQALSRSLYSRMIPPGDEAAFFAIYEISGSGTSWMGPLIFAVVVAATNSYRDALLSLIALFAVGSILVAMTSVERAFEEAVA
ncbi:MAG: MFS transporter [Vicinamibacteria bacterium]